MLKIAEFHLSLNRFVYETNKENLLTVVREGDDQHSIFHVLNDEVELGLIVTGSNFSGAVFVARTCIGEYDRNLGKYTVTPYENCGGLKNIEKREEVHPLDYLIRFLDQ